LLQALLSWYFECKEAWPGWIERHLQPLAWRYEPSAPASMWAQLKRWAWALRGYVLWVVSPVIALSTLTMTPFLPDPEFLLLPTFWQPGQLEALPGWGIGGTTGGLALVLHMLWAYPVVAVVHLLVFFQPYLVGGLAQPSWQ